MDQLLKLISGLSITQRISILLAALVTAAGIFAFSRWKHEGDFRPLYSSMSLEDSSGVVQKLRESGVEYRLSENGSTVLVPSAKLAESRLALAAAGLPKTGRIGFELFDKTNFGTTDFVEHINYKRALEGELERSVTSLAEVEQARVHITLPKESVFLDKEQPAKASVMLKLRLGSQISQQNALAIANVVASAVEGLSPEAVSIVDMNGSLLRRPRKRDEADGSQATAESLEVRQQIERDLIAKIHQTLEPVLGGDRFRAGASVDCDLTSGEQQEETFDPTHSVMASSQKTEDLTERPSAGGGIPGTASNLPGGAAAGHPAAAGVSRRTENVSFQTSRLIRHTRIPQGVIRRMSLSVLVDNTIRWEGNGAARRRVLEPPPQETIKTIRDLVAAATGFNADRGDQLTVESLPFEITVNSPPPPIEKPVVQIQPAPLNRNWLEAIRANRTLLSASVASVVVLFVLLVAGARLTIGKSRSRVAIPPGLQEAVHTGATAIGENGTPQIGSPGLPALIPVDDSLEVAARVRQFAQSELEVAANIIRFWLHEGERRVK